MTGAMQTVEVVEIRARHDRNRLLGTYDPILGVLRLFHRGQTVTINLSLLANDANQPIDYNLNIE
jgi:hypothetical protein